MLRNQLLVAGLTAASVLCFALVGVIACAQVPVYETVTIHNDVPRRDVKGDIIDAHDGCLQFFNGRYYLYGTAYGRTAGFSINNRFRVYSSNDLEHWTLEGELLKAPIDGVYYRPYVVYNPTTRKYVLWYNWYPKLWDGRVGVAVSDTPVGPFAISNSNVHLSQAADHPGDGSVFVDKDNTAYFIYTVIGQGHGIRVEKLTSDFLGSTGVVSRILAKGCEAPALFRWDDAYYALFDSACCFCTNGSGARVYKASSPLGPYTQLGNINRDDANSPIIHGQQTFVASLPTQDGPTLLWMSDRWGSRPDGIKGHDLQYWLPLRFSPDGNIASFINTPSFILNVRRGVASKPAKRPYAWPTKPDPNPVIIDACTKAKLTEEEQGVILKLVP